MLSLNIGNDYNRRPLILAPLMMDRCPSFFQEDVEDSVLQEFFQVVGIPHHEVVTYSTTQVNLKKFLEYAVFNILLKE